MHAVIFFSLLKPPKFDGVFSSPQYKMHYNAMQSIKKKEKNTEENKKIPKNTHKAQSIQFTI